jgi:ribosomal protein S18 acetylase RimI-like enzyme
MNHKNHSIVTIQILQEKDIDLLVQKFSFAWTTPQITLQKWQQYYKDQESGNRTAFIIEKENSIIGYASLLSTSQYPFFLDNQITEINDIWIKKEKRGQGFGSTLIKYLEKMAQEEGFKKIGIDVGLYADYGLAQKLYFKLGYIPDGNGITYKYSAGYSGSILYSR